MADDIYKEALQRSIKKKYSPESLRDDLMISPDEPIAQMGEQYGMAGMGSIDDLRRGIKIPFPEGVDLKIRKAAKGNYPETEELDVIKEDPRLKKAYSEYEINQALKDRKILDQIKEAKEGGYKNPFSREPIEYQAEYQAIINRIKKLLGEE